MKQLTHLLLVTGLLLGASAAMAGEKTCKVTTNDIGTIVGQGESREAAFEDAAVKCFDRHAQLYRMTKGKDVDAEAGEVMIDVCANIRCG
ncbi:MAG TPA: hypothetical protein VM432_14210 [Bdellovibrionales bacterium]|jgi:hypothetical protein|nr:hypothetical protein [Bdellovibrionales bacterium]